MIPGAPPPEPQDLTRVVDRLGFLYVERCVVHRDANAVTVTDERGTIHVPAASLNVLMVGPGSTVTHQAVVVLADSGSSLVWVGEKGVRYYAHGRPLSRSTRLLEAQARVVSNPKERLRAARLMYSMRFPGEDVSTLTMQQLRGREGARVRRSYRAHARRTGVPWDRRNYDVGDFLASDPVNQALSAANSALYGLVHAVIVSLGCAPGLGVIHTGHERSLVYDIADLYKAETAIPVAFDVAASGSLDVASETRRAMRDRMHKESVVERCVRDLATIFNAPDAIENEWADVIFLWDPVRGRVAGGENFDPDPGAEDGSW